MRQAQILSDLDSIGQEFAKLLDENRLLRQILGGLIEDQALEVKSRGKGNAARFWFFDPVDGNKISMNRQEWTLVNEIVTFREDTR